MNAIVEKLGYNQGVLGFGSRLVVRWPYFRNILILCLYEVLFYFAYRYGMAFSHACASPFWFPDSVLLCALLSNPPRRWWFFVLAPLPIRLLVAVPPEVPLWFLLGTFAIDSAKGLLVAAVLRRFLKNPLRLETVQEFAMYCLFAVLLIPAASAFVGATARHSLGHDYWPAWELQRGGSFLCTDQYCTRYMMGTRGKGDVDTGSNHLGFRCVRQAAPAATAK